MHKKFKPSIEDYEIIQINLIKFQQPSVKSKNIYKDIGTYKCLCWKQNKLYKWKIIKSTKLRKYKIKI